MKQNNIRYFCFSFVYSEKLATETLPISFSINYFIKNTQSKKSHKEEPGSGEKTCIEEVNDFSRVNDKISQMMTMHLRFSCILDPYRISWVHQCKKNLFHPSARHDSLHIINIFFPSAKPGT